MICLKFLFVIAHFLGWISLSQAQENIEFNLKGVQIITTIDWKEYKNAEIQSIKSLPDKWDILILSELDHGHGSSLDAQSMILKELIDSSKIDVLYLESSWINCDRIVSTLHEAGVAGIQESVKYMTTYELRYWVKTGFWEYLARKIIEKKITLKGFDIAGVSPIIIDELFSESLQLPFSKKFAAGNELEFNKVKFDFEFFEGWKTSSYFTREGYITLQKYISGIIQDYRNQKNFYRIQQWESILNLFYWMFKRFEALAGNKIANQIKDEKQNSRFHAVRDSLMADFFLKKYRLDSNRKVVCSMASYHSLRGSYFIDGISECCKTDDVKTMGEIIHKALPNKIYSICFITGSGEYGIDDLGTGKGKSIKNPKKGSLEFFLNKQNIDYCFIDLRDGIKRNPFCMNAVFNRYLKSEWHNNFSSVFFIKKMKPLSLLTLKNPQ